MASFYLFFHLLFLHIMSVGLNVMKNNRPEISLISTPTKQVISLSIALLKYHPRLFLIILITKYGTEINIINIYIWGAEKF